jgi:hypothetical protein
MSVGSTSHTLTTGNPAFATNNNALMDVCELIIDSTAISDADLIATRKYLLNKWGSLR